MLLLVVFDVPPTTFPPLFEAVGLLVVVVVISRRVWEDSLVFEVRVSEDDCCLDKQSLFL